MKKMMFYLCSLIVISSTAMAKQPVRKIENFNQQWQFILDSVTDYTKVQNSKSDWRKLNLPHDWSIEFPFDSTSPSGNHGGALRGGLGWYKKKFVLPASSKNKEVSIDFDGVYMNSDVWVNGHYLGNRPYGYSSFRYLLTPYLKFGSEENTFLVKVNNLQQPNSRWYSGSGIYRNVWLVTTNKIHVNHWGTFITTPIINKQQASVVLNTQVVNSIGQKKSITLTTIIYDKSNKQVAQKTTTAISLIDSLTVVKQQLTVALPHLWSVTDPYLYKAVTTITADGKLVDEYSTPLGIRSFEFDVNKGFSLNGKQLKINGVCMHHDLGCLGTAVNTRAMERQLEILKAMGCNGIRTSHNPPAPELLDLCDKMGFIVMDEAFDCWKKKKTTYDYNLYWDKWYKRDLEDLLRRDRNHPSIFVWSIGNEIPEQFEPIGATMGKELVEIVKKLDSTRPVTSALHYPDPKNSIYQSGALDLVGFNYKHQEFAGFNKNFPGKKFIGTETVSGLQTRGHYDLLPQDTIRRWPVTYEGPFTQGNKDLSASSYDNVSALWGATHEETWKEIKRYEFLSGQFIWTGFDYIGEPTPYPFPARSSLFGIVDLAGFPKDVYYMYQSEWTNKDVLHILPHWNWKAGDIVDVWAYYNNADEVELFLNGKSLGVRKKVGEDLHVSWKVNYTDGTVKAVSRKNGKTVLTKQVATAGAPAKIILSADRKLFNADGKDLSFITAKVVDANGVMVPDANNQIEFTVKGNAFIAGTDNGSQTSLESFKDNNRKAFNGLALAVVQVTNQTGTITITAKSKGLQPASVVIVSK